MTIRKLSPVTHGKDIAAAQQRLARTVYANIPARKRLHIITKGDKGKPHNLLVHCDIDGFWVYIRPGKPAGTTHYWNSFGRMDRSENYVQTPHLECNPPHTGDNRQQGALFAQASNGTTTYLVHTGKIGGGKKHVGKANFLTWLRSRRLKDLKWVKIDDEPVKAILLGSVDSPQLIGAIKYYMDLAWEFKTSRSAPHHMKKSGKASKKYHSRRRGNGLGKLVGSAFSAERYRSTTKRKKVKIVRRKHGKVVGSLKEWALRRYGKPLVVGNNQTVDLLLGQPKTGHVMQVFEVKTNTGTQAMYTAIGQLLVHASRTTHKTLAKMTLVVPYAQVIDPEIYQVIKRHKIEVYTYRHKKRGHNFSPYTKSASSQ
ncbi:MAG: hypothetical protein ACRETA_06765 [Gammaproteobacteria bacterium]